MNWLGLFSELGFRYGRSLVIAGTVYSILYLIFWRFGKERFKAWRVKQTGHNAPAMPHKEAFFTALNLGIYLLPVGAVFVVENLTGYTAKYTHIDDYGWPYFFFSIFLMAAISDTWFYWVHRWLHTAKIRAHNLHHKSMNPTPFASYSFHIYEGFVVSISYSFILFFVPWHPIALLIYVLASMTMNGFLHLGYDPLPKSWRENSVLKWFNTPSHHCGHHQRFNSNYGLYFTFWDKVMKTEKID